MTGRTPILLVGAALLFGAVPLRAFEAVLLNRAECSAVFSSEADRLEKGAAAQAEIFGEHMLEAWKAGHINRWLAANCFGDYYTRGGLDLRQRELITFCFLAAQGGCEPQLIAHARGNINMGSDPAFLRRVVSQCLPYIGYPRSLNALSAIDKAAEG